MEKVLCIYKTNEHRFKIDNTCSNTKITIMHLSEALERIDCKQGRMEYSFVRFSDEFYNGRDVNRIVGFFTQVNAQLDNKITDAFKNHEKEIKRLSNEHSASQSLKSQKQHYMALIKNLNKEIKQLRKQVGKLQESDSCSTRLLAQSQNRIAEQKQTIDAFSAEKSKLLRKLKRLEK